MHLSLLVIQNSLLASGNMSTTDVSLFSMGGLSLWVGLVGIGTMVMVAARVHLLQYLLQIVLEMVWIPWTVEKQMRMQGHGGPSFSVFTNNEHEIHEIEKKAPSGPMLTSSGINHDLVPRLLGPIHTWRNLYGDKFLFKHGSRVSMYVSDPDALKEIFSNKSSEFERSRLAAISFDLFGSDGLVFAQSEEWARQRKVVKPAFFPGRFKKLEDQMASWIELWLQSLEKMVDDTGGSLDIDMSPQLYHLTKDILARSSFGSNFGKGMEGFNHQEKHRNLLIQQGLSSNPLLWWVPTDLKKEIAKEKGEVLRCLREIIQERRKSIDPENIESYGEDLMGLLLADRDRRLAVAGRPPGEGETEDEHITDQCRTFFFAGAETVDTSLSWATVLLGHHTDWQERIRAEVQEVFKTGGSSIGEKLVKLKQLEMFVAETLRLYSPIPILHREVVKKNTKLVGESVPKHLVLFMDLLTVHRDKEYWGDDSLQFKPERFAHGVGKACKNPFAYNPFGGGPKICVAQSFAQTEMKLILAMLLQRFSVRLSPSYRHEPIVGGDILRPKFGIQIVLELLQPTPA